MTDFFKDLSFSSSPLIASGLIILMYFLLNGVLRKVITSIGEFKKVPVGRHTQVYKYFRFILIVFTAVALLVAWGIDYKGLAVLATSILAMLAVALVAQWSILSNVTAGVLIFFAFPVRIGDKMEIIDGTSSVTGEIIEINLFQIILEDDDGQLISYPNNLLLQKAVRKIQPKPSTIKATTVKRMQDRLK